MNVHRWLNVVIVCLTPSYCYGQSVSPPPPCEGAPKPISKRPIYEGATYSKIPLPDEYDGCAYFVTINPTTSIFRVLASGAEKHGSPRALYLGDYIGKENAVIAVSGGYMSSFSPPKALGLVKVNGRQISAPHTTWLGKGMVCTDGRLPKIANYDELKATSLSDCLQSGPLLIDGGKVRYPAPTLTSEKRNWLNRNKTKHSFVLTQIMKSNWASRIQLSLMHLVIFSRRSSIAKMR
jgi:hypothetical protein